jgi:hypothetical protein
MQSPPPYPGGAANSQAARPDEAERQWRSAYPVEPPQARPSTASAGAVGAAVALVFMANLAVSIAAGLGIYSFSGSWLWAVVGSVALTGTARANPLLALGAYPAVELFFGNGLSIYSAVIVGITAIQMAFVFGMAASAER